MSVRFLLLAVVAGVGLIAAPAPAATQASLKYGASIVTRVNTIRADHDRARLSRSKCLQRLADKQAQAMADQHRLFHQDLHRVQKVCHVGWVGENVAYAPYPAAQMVQMWMKSPGHKANILKKPYRMTGVGAHKSGQYWWASQLFARKG